MSNRESDGERYAENTPQKSPHERLLDARLHFKMARVGPLSKADERIQRGVDEIEELIP